jgi:hypothetical protein
LAAWNPGANGNVYSLLLSGGTLYVSGDFTLLGGQVRNRLGSVDAVSGAATAFDPNCNGRVSGVGLYGPTLYLGGNFTTAGGQPRTRLAAVDAASGAVQPWNPQVDGIVNSFLLRGAEVYAGGQFTSADGLARPSLAAFSVPGEVGVAPLPAPVAAVELAPCAPNPAGGTAGARTLVRFALPSACSVTLGVYDVAGRRVAQPLGGELRPAGANEIPLELAAWPAGLYFVRLEAAGEVRGGKLLVIE